MGAGDVTRRTLRLARSAAAAAILAAALPSVAGELQATSSDGRWLLRADNASRTLLAVDARTGAVVKRIPVTDRGGASSRVTRVLDAPSRRSFVVLLADLPEAWELPYDPQAPPVFDGMVHDYRTGEGIESRGPLPVRRIVLDGPLADALFAPEHDAFVARAADGALHVVNLDVRRVIERIGSGGEPVPQRGLAWVEAATLRFAIPDAQAPRVYVLSSDGWRIERVVDLAEAATRVLRLADGSVGVELISGRRSALAAPR